VATHDLAWFSSSHSFPSKSTPPFQLPSGTCDQKVVFSELSVGAKKELWISTVESELQWFIQQLFNAWDGIFLHSPLQPSWAPRNFAAESRSSIWKTFATFHGG
jgi:hypothetical protein